MRCEMLPTGYRAGWHHRPAAVAGAAADIGCRKRRLRVSAPLLPNGPMAAMTDRLIAHLDMDAFYASVELLRRPELRGLPVVVGGARARSASDTGGKDALRRLRDYVGRGVVTTATYEARALGVGSAMGLMKAARLAPDAILLPADFDAYHRFSRRFKDAVRAVAPTIEDRGIDEIYIDLSDVIPVGHPMAVVAPGGAQSPPPLQLPAGGDRALLLGRALKDAVHAATGLTASVGIAPNKLLAKIASDLDKPDGLTIVTPADLPTRIWPLLVRCINGVGPKAEARLLALGYRTIGDLARADRVALAGEFGAHSGQWLHDVAHGVDGRPVVTAHDPKSISREVTLERDLDVRRDRPELTALLTGLCERVAADLRRHRVGGRTVGVKLRFSDFVTVTRDRTSAFAVHEPLPIRDLARACLRRIPLDRRIRLLGVRVTGLQPLDPGAPGNAETGWLFD